MFNSIGLAERALFGGFCLRLLKQVHDCQKGKKSYGLNGEGFLFTTVGFLPTVTAAFRFLTCLSFLPGIKVL